MAAILSISDEALRITPPYLVVWWYEHMPVTEMDLLLANDACGLNIGLETV